MKRFETITSCGEIIAALKKTLLIMRISIFIMFASVLSIMAGETYSQHTHLSIKLKSVTVEQALLEIEDNSEFFFLYNSRLIDVKRIVNIDVKNRKVNEILDELFEGQEIEYIIKDRQIILAPKNYDQLYSGSRQPGKEITGQILSEEGLPLPGVNVVEKSTTNGTVTDINGNYSILLITDDATLIYSFVGYTTQNILVGSQQKIDITLMPDLMKLDEVVVVGYGTQRKSDLTGAVATVNAAEMKKYSSNDVSQLLQGRLSGVAVTSDGEAGATPSVRIRGLSTFENGEPLYVIDGVPVTGQRDFSPNDIESISVLKDASAGAIYGAAAANGVILITTKRGVKNTPMRIDYSGYFGIDKIWQKIPVTRRVDFQTLQNEMLRNGGLFIYRGNNPESPEYIDDIDTDWQEEAFKTGTRQNHNLAFSGGSESSMYNLSVDYFQSDGTLVGSGPNYKRYSVRVNSETEKGIFRVGENVYYTHSFQDGLTATSDWLSGGRPPMIGDLLLASPIVPVYDTSRVGGFGGTPMNGAQGVSANIVGLNTLIENSTEVDRALANVWGEVEILKGLKYKINLSYDRTFVRDIRFSPLYDMGYFINNLTASKLTDNDRIYTKSLIENTLNYNSTFGKHSLNLLAGQMFSTGRYDFKYGYSEQLPEPYYTVLDNGTNQSSGGFFTETATLSYLGRINYSFDDRYLVTVTTRRDASSRFAPANRWGTFPSAAVAWKVHKESFIHLPRFIAELKIRASYGQMGNDKIDDYLYATTVNENIPYNFNGVKVYGAAQTQLVDEAIKWETKTMSNVGFDAVFLRGAIEWSAEYYHSISTDLLASIDPPRTTGANNAITTNAASLKNTGLETSLTYRRRSTGLNFDVTVNFSTLRNEVLELGGGKEYVDGAASRTEVGRPIGEFYGFVCEGVFQTADQINSTAPGTVAFDSTKHAFQSAKTSPGDLIFKDIDGYDATGTQLIGRPDGKIDNADRAYLGHAIPRVYYGLNFSASYKRFDLTFNASGAGGYKIHSRTYATLMHVTDYMNYHQDVLQRWTPDNPSDKYPRLVQTDPNANVRMSNREGWLQNGTHLRINTASLGYSLPANLIKHISTIRVYVTGQNLYTFQYYKSFNPDFTSGVWNPGFDNGSYPKPRTVLFGIQASF